MEFRRPRAYEFIFLTGDANATDPGTMLGEPLIAAEISFVEFWNSNRNEEGELKESKIS